MDARAVCFSITVLSTMAAEHKEEDEHDNGRARRSAARRKEEELDSRYDEPDCVHEVHVSRTNDYLLVERKREKQRE